MLDKTDRKLLNALQEDGKATIKELAQKLNLTTSPVFERVKRLEKEKVISGYTALVDYHKVDRGQLVICNVSMPNYTPENIRAFKEKIDLMPEVLECYHFAGEIDYQLKILVKDIQDYYEFQQKFTQLNMVRIHSSMVVLKQIKQTTKVEL